nr:MAG TPA: hypothetical protein [Caudoviricetes sp.]
MEKYVFSGSLTDEMHDMLLKMPEFEPLDILITQLDRSAIKKAIEWKKDGFCRWLFIDSGAFSVHTGKASTTADEYLDYLNSIDEFIDVCAQLDTIPGTFGQPKSKEDYEQSAKKSWENFLYMRSHMKSPHKLMPVFHFGEDFSALKNMLNWRDENGDLLDYIGISPANDASQEDKNAYLQNVADVIASSINPHVKTHLYGMTSLDALSKYPCYSADSISHRLIAGYAKILSAEFGIISVSKKSRTTKSKSNMSFVETADEYNMKKLTDEIESLGFTLEQIQESSSARVVMTMHNIQKLIKTKYAYHPKNVRRQKKLF